MPQLPRESVLQAECATQLPSESMPAESMPQLPRESMPAESMQAECAAQLPRESMPRLPRVSTLQAEVTGLLADGE